MIKVENHIIKGMQRDLSVSKFNPEYAFECKNIRMTAREYNTLLSVTNERGNRKLDIVNLSGAPFKINGVLIGYCILNQYIVLFTTDNGTDYIYRLELDVQRFKALQLYTGKLNFNTLNPIETLGIYENEDIQKVYWVDGINQARVINIVASIPVRSKWDNNSFDFVQKLKLTETITVSRNDTASGLFAPGVIQYAFSYYNKYGQQSNIFHTTTLQYISFSNRGASPEDKVSNSFTINISNIDNRFDYIRVYSIHRTSIDDTPTVRNIVDLPINAISRVDNISYTDNGTTGSIIDPTELLYIGGDDIVFKTITQKDNTLFLGNINIKRKLLSDNIISAISGGTMAFRKRTIGNFGIPKGYYPYKNSLSLGAKIKTLKYLEWYRFGIQFQHITGKWSEPVWVNDAQNVISPSYNNGNLNLVQANYIIPQQLIPVLVEQGYIKARGVIVYPSNIDREVVAQGMLSPTVYNIGDRFSNSPFVQSSWFSRPNLAFDIDHNLDNWAPTSTNVNFTESKAAVVNNQNVTSTLYVDIINKGAWAEFRHNFPIPNNWERNAEIQVLANVPKNSYTQLKGSDLVKYTADHKEYFMVDQSILTFHSPDIEFDTSVQNIDTSNLKLRIVGIIPMTANASDIDIQTSTPPNAVDRQGFYKEIVGSENMSVQGIKNLISGAYWFDKATDLNQGVGDYTQSFFVYAWHRNGSLNNQGPTVINESGITGIRSAMLDKKKISNLKFSAFTHYFSKPWEAYISGDKNHTGITQVNIFNSNEQTLIRIPEPENSDLGELNYYGNVDKVISPSIVNEKYTITKKLNIGEITQEFNKKDGYPIIVTGQGGISTDSHKLFTSTVFPLKFLDISSVNSSTDAVRMKYKSTPHAVFALNWTKDKKQIVLPTIMEEKDSDSWTVNQVLNNTDINTHFFWNPKAKYVSDSSNVSDSIYQDVIDYRVTQLNNIYSFLYLAELYRTDVTNRFGGTTEEAFENNQWLPAGESVSLISGYNQNGEPIPLQAASVNYEEGDTFLQRYDCLKTYPSTLEDQNSITEIVSFMCETRVNIDGRYDRNRGQLNNLSISPENFNKVNQVYNQKDNFFNYRGVNHSKFNLDNFPNAVTWTKEKQIGSIIDTWTNITMASTLDLDGDKGEITSLNTFNNEIFCFQKKAFSNILFNSRIQIPTSDSVPIEITNGLKVTGKRYISNSIGCVNKWSIVESPAGLYFIDNETNSMYLFNGQIRNLSDQLGFRQWIGDNNSNIVWDPSRFYNFIGFYDKNNDDIYFVNKDSCLCYSELLGQFTSFMSYENVPAMFNITSRFFAFKDGNIWEQFAGEYNSFFGQYQPYYVTIVANENSIYDKIYNTVEFRSSSYLGNNLVPDVTFDTLDVYNDYQHGSTNLTNINGHSSSLKRKFRIWRATIPRANQTINGIVGNNKDRIRNPWSYVKLSSISPNKYRTELFDISVGYTI